MNSSVLLVDDDRQVLTVLQLGLSPAGFKVMIASDTREAETLVRNVRFDVVVCDVTMPIEDGFEFRERLERSNVKLPPFIYCSGVLIKKDVVRKPGVIGFLEKPISMADLIHAVREAVAGQVSRGASTRSEPSYVWT